MLPAIQALGEARGNRFRLPWIAPMRGPSQQSKHSPMWLITPDGFYSAVQKPNTSHLTIRARSGADLDRLRRNWIPELSANEYGAGRDYPVRATCSHQAFAQATARMAASIDYEEFQAEVALRHSADRARAYRKVWSGLLQIEREPTARGPFPRAPRGDKLTYGGLLLDSERQRVLLVADSEGGWSFVRASLHRGASAEDAVISAVQRSTGIETRVRGSLFKWYPEGCRQTAYFVLEPLGEVGEGARHRWVDVLEAEQMIRRSGNRAGVQRDLQVLGDLQHRLGYQPV